MQLTLQPDLFGGWELLRESGRAGGRSQLRRELFLQADEARHADHAQQAGARTLPAPIPTLMAGASKLMKAVAYRL